MSARRTGLAAAAVLLVAAIALGLRLRAVDLLPIDYDEDDYLRAGQQMARAMREGDWGRLTELNYRPEHPPLNKLAYGAALVFLPDAPEIPDRPTTAGPAASLPQPHLRTARTAAAVLGALEALALAILNPLAGLMLAVHTFTIKYTSQVMLEALPALTGLVAGLAYERSRRRRGGWLALSAVALGLTAAGKYLYAVVGLAIFAHWLLSGRLARRSTSPTIETGGRQRLGWLPLLLWALLAAAVFLAADPYLWPDPVGRLAGSVLYHGGYARSAAVQAAGLPPWQPLVWLVQSVPWHPDVFLVSLDALIAVLAIFGLKRLWCEHSFYAVWLALGLGVLLVWPTKWPQYILILTAPFSLAAALGLQELLWRPFLAWLGAVRQRADASAAAPRRSLAARARSAGRTAWAALPWLLPGLVLLVLITYYPLLYQVGIGMTDFGATSIKDGINGGIGREVRAGLSGRVAPLAIDVFSSSRSLSKTVHYTGLRPFLQFFTGLGSELVVFEAIWTILLVGLQTLVGVAIALMLARAGLRLRAFWQTLFILPWAIPEFVGALAWAQVFDPRYGWFFLGTSFPETPGYAVGRLLAGWTQDPGKALFVLLAAGTWLGFPLIMLAASAGLQTISQEIYDAAAMDGAGGWRRFRYVTWPLLLPLLAPALIIRAIYAFNQFYLFYTLDTPWPLVTFASLSYFIFHLGGRYAVSAIINVFTVLLLAAFLIWFIRRSRAAEGVTYA